VAATPTPGVTAASSAAATKLLGSGTPGTTLWSEAVLVAAQLPVNTTNISNLNAWIANEQAKGTWSQGVNGAHGPLGNTGGDASNPAQAAVQTAGLLTTSSYYTPIVKALEKSVPLALFAGAVTSTPWNGNRYGGASAFVARAKANNYGNYSASGADTSPFSGLVNPKGFVGQYIEPLLTGTAVGLNATGEKTATNDVAGALGVTSVGGLIGDITNPTTLKNVGIFVLGLTLAGVGLLIFFSQTKAAKDVEGAAVKAA
jgi:hypothetical protein